MLTAAMGELMGLWKALQKLIARRKTVPLYADGKAYFLMKGIINMADLMRAVFRKEHGLCPGLLTSHCMFFQTLAYPTILLLIDGGINPFPTLEQSRHSGKCCDGHDFYKAASMFAIVRNAGFLLEVRGSRSDSADSKLSLFAAGSLLSPV